MANPLLVAGAVAAAGLAAKKFLSKDRSKVSTEIRVVDEAEVPDWAKSGVKQAERKNFQIQSKLKGRN